MKCKICGCENVEITYRGKIRDGKVGVVTPVDVEMYQCSNCSTIWHDTELDFEKYYESEQYRISLEGTTDIEKFYEMHDYESMDKFKCTGTEIFRDRIVADIGCGGGAFLDCVRGLAKKTIAIEPSEVYRKSLFERGNVVYPYMQDALKDFSQKIDTIVSFDVIEHVSNPIEFVEQANGLLASGGKCIIGTPTDAPVMRELLGNDYNSFLFSTQHPWVLSEGTFKVMAEKCNISNYQIKYYQRYGLGNLMHWLLNKTPGKHKEYEFIKKSVDMAWRASLEEQGKSDYILFEFTK